MLSVEIDEKNGVVNFDAGIPVSCNLDSSSMNILSSAKDAFPKGRPPKSLGQRNQGEPTEWRR